jgi:hypothetical protein
MKFRLASLTAVAVMFGGVGVVSADTYLGLGIGTEAPLTGSMGDSFTTDDSTHGRLMIGSRFGRLGIEGSLFGTELGAQGMSHTLAALGVDLKYHIKLSGPLELYLKGGLHRAYLRSDYDAALEDYAGNGHQYGAGIQYRFDLALTSAALWLDYNRTKFDIDDDAGRRFSGTGKLLTIGLSIGI